MMRLASGSIVVASVCYGVWNGLAYSFFGFGELLGVLGIEQSILCGPELGLLGFVFNMVVFSRLWRRYKN